MKDNRDSMYFPGPQGMAPQGMMPQGMGPMGAPMGSPMGPGMMGQGYPGQMMPNVNQLENRLATLERQVKRLDARISRLETPYPAPTTTTTTTYPGSTGSFQSGDAQDQPYNYPYQTSMQVM